ncbi:MAG: hypothetical protein M3X11_10255 [Acidobacteriota bacterium]|nr:hypothetical protein [Acidobacteriota bacterium]
MRRELAYLDDILECIARVEEYLTGVDEATFQDQSSLAGWRGAQPGDYWRSCQITA